MPATERKRCYGLSMKHFQTLSGTALPQTCTSQPLQGQSGIFVKSEDYLLGLGIRDVSKFLLRENFAWKWGFFLRDLAQDFIYLFVLKLSEAAGHFFFTAQ